MPDRTVMIEKDNLSSYMESLAEWLRADSLALTGHAALHSQLGKGQGDPELEALSDSLRRAATKISAIGGGLCQACRMLVVIEGLTVEKPKSGPGRKGGRRKAPRKS